MSKYKAKFSGWMGDGFEYFPLFNLFGEGDRNNSTVSLETLKELGVKIPDYPSRENWGKK